MSAAATRTRIVKRVSRWSQPGHGDTRPDRRPSAGSTAPLVPNGIVTVAQASSRPTSARLHFTGALSRLASAASTAIKSP